MTSKRPPHVRAARATGFRPRVEALEQRCCPSSNNLLDDGTLLTLAGVTADSTAVRHDAFLATMIPVEQFRTGARFPATF